MVRRGINLKETLLHTRVMDATVQFKWNLPTTKLSWQTPLDTFVPRQASHIHLHAPPRCPKPFRPSTQLDTKRHVPSIYHKRSILQQANVSLYQGSEDKSKDLRSLYLINLPLQLVHSSFKTHENSSFKNSCDILDIFDSVDWYDYALMCPKLRSSHRVRSGHLTGLAQNSCAQSHSLVSKNRVMKLEFLTTVSQVLRHSMSWVFETWVQLSSLWVIFCKKQNFSHFSVRRSHTQVALRTRVQVSISFFLKSTSEKYILNITQLHAVLKWEKFFQAK
jgi:hypothetical protein